MQIRFQCAERKKAIDQPCRTTSAIIFDSYAAQLFVVLWYFITYAIDTINIVTMDRCNAHHRPHEHTNFDVVHGLRIRFIFVNFKSISLSPMWTARATIVN